MPRSPPAGSLQHIDEDARWTAIGVGPPRDFAGAHKTGALGNLQTGKVACVDVNLDTREGHVLQGGPRETARDNRRAAPKRVAPPKKPYRPKRERRT